MQRCTYTRTRADTCSPSRSGMGSLWENRFTNLFGPWSGPQTAHFRAFLGHLGGKTGPKCSDHLFERPKGLSSAFGRKMRLRPLLDPIGVPKRPIAKPLWRSMGHRNPRQPHTGRSLTQKKKCSGTSFPKKARGHSMCSTMVGGGWRLAVGGSWRLAVGNWRLVAVGGGWRWLVVGGWWLVAVGSGWQLAVGRRWRLAAIGGGWWLVAGGGWRLMGVGGWRLVVPWGGP